MDARPDGEGVRVIAGRYEIGALLGTGGMSAVFAAHDRRLDRQVAIKLVPVEGTDPTDRARFVREAQSGARFTHPNAVAVHDAGEADGYLYLVMERVDVRSLAAVLADEGALSHDEAVAIAQSVLAALAKAHAAGIVHRDVKPSNILLADDGAVKLMDFGIAKRLDDLAGDVTKVGEIIGTPKYLAPEQTTGAGVSGPASDVYAVGVVLFEMLTGLPPFDGGTPMATVQAHRTAPVPDVRTFRPDVTDALAATVHRALDKDPERRFASAGDMLAALQQPSAGPAGTSVLAAPPLEPTQVLPPGGYERRALPAWSIAALAALVAGGATLAFIIVRDGGGGETTATSTTVAASASTVAAPSTTTPRTQTVPSTTIAVVAAAAPSQPPNQQSNPGSVDDLIATLQASPETYGERTGDIVSMLRDVRGNGQRAAERSVEILDTAANWVNEGHLQPQVLDVLEPVLGPLAARDNRGGEGGDDEEGDD